MKNALKMKVLAAVLSLAGCLPAGAQKTAAWSDPDRTYRMAMELFTKEKYSAAMQEFERYLQADPGPSLNRTSAEFHAALCAAGLYHPDGEKRIHAFVTDHPESTWSDAAAFALGRIYYKKRKYSDAIAWFEKTDVVSLDNDELAEYYFKLGYSYYSKKDMDKASSAFHQILKTESRYRTAANYYYGHVAYANNNYKTALAAFESLRESETFGRLVPYYIVQIYYEQGKYDEVIGYGVPELKKGTADHAAEINRVVAESYYRKGNYAEALAHLEEYRKNWPAPTREDYYLMGYCQYKTGHCTEAIERFEKVVNVKDATAQMAYYHLGDCFLKGDNKQSARSSFQFAAQMEFDPAIREDARFNYAKLSYELNFQPVAVKALTEYVTEYPGTPKTDEANELLAQVYLTTRNYKDALEALEKITAKSDRARAAYQKVAYFRAVEFYNDRENQKAIDLFTKAIITGNDPVTRALAMYWKAEAFYGLGQFEQAVKQYRIFVFNAGSVNTPVFNDAYYGLGYAHFRLEHYAEANDWFRKFVRNKESVAPARYNDALIRIADGFFMERDNAGALAYYTRAADGKAAASDYCLFQTGIIRGIEGDMQQKTRTMEQLMAKYPKSAYLDDAVYEAGTAWMALNDNARAKKQFEKLIAEHTGSTYVRKARLNIALIHYNAREDDAALAMYKKVIADYPSTPEAAEALTGVKNIYVNAGNPDQYFAYIKTVPFAAISTGAQDSITYEAAEQRFMKGETDKASGDFASYLSRFPDGAFALNARFYKAECDARLGRRDDALEGYEAIAALPRNLFTEKSLLKAADIHFAMKNHETAVDRYNRLEEMAEFRDNLIASQVGQMRCQYRLGRFNAAGINAQKVIAQDKASTLQHNEAHLVYGKVLIETREYAGAAAEFKTLSAITNSAMGAEAKYQLARLAFLQNNHAESLKRCFAVINQVPAYDFWVANSFLLLADNYLALGDTFQAKHTLKSLIDNYEASPDDERDIAAEASQRYQALVKRENESLRKPDDAGTDDDETEETALPAEKQAPAGQSPLVDLNK